MCIHMPKVLAHISARLHLRSQVFYGDGHFWQCRVDICMLQVSDGVTLALKK